MDTPHRNTLVRAQDAIATAVVDRQFTNNPHLIERIGAQGKRKCREDARYHVLYLTEAVAAQSPALFRHYATWLNGLLGGLGIPRDDLIVQFQTIAEVLQESFDGTDARIAIDYLDDIVQNPDSIEFTVEDHLPADDHLAGSILSALLGCDRLRAIQYVDQALDDGMTIDTLYLEVFQPLLHEVGSRWQTNRMSVAQEHYCTAAIQLMMGRLADRIFASDRNGFTLVAACVGDELHDVGLRMVADLLQANGWDSHFLGANVPKRDLLQAIRSASADVVCLSTTLTSHLTTTHDVITAIRADPSLQHIKIVVGGYPFNAQEGLWRRMNADGYAKDAREAISICTGLVGP